MIDYAGCIHFHSNYSYDACIPLARILESGFKTHLDFAILTDHFHLDARRDGWEKYHLKDSQKLLLIVGEEISPRYNHYLAFNIDRPIVVPQTLSQPQVLIDAVNEQGGFGFIAHPDHPGSPLAHVRAFPWLDWSVKRFAGLSIWDLMGDWSSALTSSWAMLKAFAFPGRALKGPQAVTLSRWDAFTQQFHCAAIGEIDNHGNSRSYVGISRRVFSFDFAFRTIRTHVLLPAPLSGEAGADRAVLLEALRQGQSYISLDLWNDPRGFSFEIFDDKRRTPVGGSFHWQGAARLEVKVPQRARIRLIRDGRLVRQEENRAYLQHDVTLAGVYRVEVDQRVCGRWRPWIFSNPIWVK